MKPKIIPAAFGTSSLPQTAYCPQNLFNAQPTRMRNYVYFRKQKRIITQYIENSACQYKTQIRLAF
ncbi:hypothetical protein D1614_21535 [Maribellus luteus]|uniref:Uncharacterized protein n=1 Tax=Maribellus luteus TaxID=2305463 RepID=A0A399SV67_9BACT|nr:hypothetical protein D1614_21535 [Maribellus luteus]